MDRDSTSNLAEGYPLVAYIASRIDRLVEECDAGIDALTQALPALRDARLRAFGARSTVPKSAAEEMEPIDAGRSDVARVEVQNASIEDLLDFQEQLARVPGVGGVSISAMGARGASLVVEILPEEYRASHGARQQPPGPTIVCSVCGRTLFEGTKLISHGLCPDCTESFLRGEVAR